KNAYGNIIRILKALKSTDNGVSEYFTAKNNGAAVSRNLCVVERFIKINHSLEIDINKWNNNINCSIWKLIDPFNTNYSILKKIIDKNNKIPHHCSNNITERQIGLWCKQLRINKKNNQLSSDKLKLLESLPLWKWDRHDDEFNENIDNLNNWVIQNNKMPSKRSNDELERKMGIWCATRRKDKKINRLNDDKIKLLENIPGWYWEKIDPFNENYNKLKELIISNNKLPSDKSNNPIEKQLYYWCGDRRSDKKNNKLDSDKILQLEALTGWYWEKLDQFDDGYDNLKKWITVNNKIPSQKSDDPTEKQLGYWCCSRRQDKKYNNLSDNKIKLLENLPNWYWEKIDLFNDNYNNLKKWLNINNKFPTSNSDDAIEKQLGVWCAAKKSDKKKNKLADDKIKLLELLPGWCWEKQNTFNIIYDDLKKWIAIHDKIPSAKSLNAIEKHLGSWCQNRRTDKKNNKLSNNNIQQLEKLTNWYWDYGTLSADICKDIKIITVDVPKKDKISIDNKMIKTKKDIFIINWKIG
ncbi:MAG: superfamily II helicase, partial [Faunusvirus sp.]